MEGMKKVQKMLDKSDGTKSEKPYFFYEIGSFWC